MRDLLLLSIHFLCLLVKLLKPGGVRAVMAENLALKQQLITLNRCNKRSPKLTSFDRFFYGLLAFIIGEHRIHKIAVILKPSTILKFHRRYKHKLPFGGGPSWLTFIGQVKDSLWSVDLFRCESVSLKSHWVMVIMDQFTRRIIGFSVHVGDCDGIAYCRMFNSIVSGYSHPKYLSSDNDPLFRFHRWKANLRIIDIEEIKTIPYVPLSHPFVERLIGTVRREYIDHSMFFNSRDLQKKLDRFQKYYNETRGHSSLQSKTPKNVSAEDNPDQKIASLNNYRWKRHCNGLYQLPVAA